MNWVDFNQWSHGPTNRFLVHAIWSYIWYSWQLINSFSQIHFWYDSPPPLIEMISCMNLCWQMIIDINYQHKGRMTSFTNLMTLSDCGLYDRTNFMKVYNLDICRYKYRYAIFMYVCVCVCTYICLCFNLCLIAPYYR